MRTKLSSERKARESKKKGKNFTSSSSSYKTRIALCLFNKSVYTTSKKSTISSRACAVCGKAHSPRLHSRQ